MSTPPVAADCRLDEEQGVLYLAGTWRLNNLPAILAVLGKLALHRERDLVLDGSRLESIDTAAAFVVLDHLERAGAGRVVERAFGEKQGRLLELVRRHLRSPFAPIKPRLGVVQQIGAATIAICNQLRRDLAFTGRVCVELAALAHQPRLFRPREAAAQFEAVCIDAIPIVILVNVLIGIVVAYVLGVEAQRYGASLFVADGIALAVCRELSPILGSVLVAGRSGAAFTAEIGTMKIEEEVDALSTMGLSPIQVLVIPRLLALAVAMPLLVLVGDAAGVAGGMLVGVSKLHIPPGIFIDRVHSVLELRHFFVGLGKAPVFALFVAMIACRMGLEVKGDARGVGRNTTSTVVQCIVWVFVLDAAFAMVFQRLGI